MLVAQYVHELFKPDSQIDQLLLGCTHYPLMLEVFRRYVPQHVTIVEQGKIVAQKLKDYLIRHQEIEKRLDQTGSRRSITTATDQNLKNLASKFYGSQIELEIMKR